MFFGYLIVLKCAFVITFFCFRSFDINIFSRFNIMLHVNLNTNTNLNLFKIDYIYTRPKQLGQASWKEQEGIYKNGNILYNQLFQKYLIKMFERFL